MSAPARSKAFGSSVFRVVQSNKVVLPVAFADNSANARSSIDKLTVCAIKEFLKNQGILIFLASAVQRLEAYRCDLNRLPLSVRFGVKQAP